MIHFDDLTEAEIAFRQMLDRKPSDFERRNTPFSIWAKQARERWAATPEGKRALAQAELRRGKIRRRIVGAGPPPAA
jgi:hypothetical protein